MVCSLFHRKFCPSFKESGTSLYFIKLFRAFIAPLNSSFVQVLLSKAAQKAPICASLVLVLKIRETASKSLLKA